MLDENQIMSTEHTSLHLTPWQVISPFIVTSLLALLELLTNQSLNIIHFQGPKLNTIDWLNQFSLDSVDDFVQVFIRILGHKQQFDSEVPNDVHTGIYFLVRHWGVNKTTLGLRCTCHVSYSSDCVIITLAKANGSFSSQTFRQAPFSPFPASYLTYVVDQLTSNVKMHVYGDNNCVRVFYWLHCSTKGNCTRIVSRLCDKMIVLQSAPLESLF